MLFQKIWSSTPFLQLMANLIFQCCSDAVWKLVFLTFLGRPGGMLHTELAVYWHLHRVGGYSCLVCLSPQHLICLSEFVCFFFSLRVAPHMLFVHCFPVNVFSFSSLSLKPFSCNKFPGCLPALAVVWPLWFVFAVWALWPPDVPVLCPCTLSSAWAQSWILQS